jgi:DNA-binding transcriptional regulator YdaS (Cro superfamily)
MEKDNVIALQRAINICGSQDALAARLRQFFVDNPSPSARTTVSQQTISYWLNSGSLLDAVWWPAFEFATDNGVTRRHLRPDVFPREHAA